MLALPIISTTSLSASLNKTEPTCSGVTAKSDCGYLGIDQPGCEAKGCCWVPADPASSDPWCFYKASSKSSCFVWADAATSAPFSDAEQASMRKYYLENVGVQGTGAVVAAPDPYPSCTGGACSCAGAGAACVSVMVGGTWKQEAYLKAPNAGAGDAFGH